MKSTYRWMLAGVWLLAGCHDSASKEDHAAGKPDTVIDKTVAPPPAEKKSPGEFSIDAIRGWTKSDTMLAGNRVVFLRSAPTDASDDFIENVNVLTQTVGNMSLDEYLNRNLEDLKNGLHQYVRLSLNDRVINGIPFKVLRYSHVYEGMPIDAEVYLAVHGGTACVITASAKGGEFDDWESDFDRIVDTFRAG